jgi:hypothetical protein
MYHIKNLFIMKTISIYLLLLVLGMRCTAQTTIDDIFRKFDGKKGVTTVNFSKDMMKSMAKTDSNNVNLFGRISGVKILTFENAQPEDKEAFAAMVKSLPLNDYKEFMVIKEKNNNVKILFKENKEKISEFLLLATGGDEPVLISIGGEIDPKELGNISGCLQGLGNFAKVNDKK